MALALADLLHEHWPGYAHANAVRPHADHYRAVRRVLACRTPEMGAHMYRCGDCRRMHFAYHSCNHRNCPQCGALDQQIWSAKQEARLLPVPYFMVTFTIPQQLRSLCLGHPKVVYDLMLRCSADTLRDVVATKTKAPDARIGSTAVLHTWGRQMQHHPHVHHIVPARAFYQKSDRVIYPDKATFLVHYAPLAARFSSLLYQALKNDHPEIYQNLTRDQRRALAPATTWNVQLQHVGRGKTALRYLARYVQRSAFAPSRLLGYDDAGRVLLRWTDSDTGKTGVLKLSPHEFIRRWLLHVLPKGFTRVRHYGYLSSAAKKTRLRLRVLLGTTIDDPLPKLPEAKPFVCEHCGGKLTFIREIARPNPMRGPP
jgi:hypothetical protein